MLFSTSDIEKAASEAFYAGLPRNKNPFEHAETWVGKLKCKLWYCEFDKIERETGSYNTPNQSD